MMQCWITMNRTGITESRRINGLKKNESLCDCRKLVATVKIRCGALVHSRHEQQRSQKLGWRQSITTYDWQSVMKITLSLDVQWLEKLVSEIWRAVLFHVLFRDVPNIRFVLTSMPNSGANSVFVFGRIVSSEQIRIVSLYSVHV